MNDLQTARSDAAFARAQAAYDRQEPPLVRECPLCNGCGRVEVAAFLDCDSKERRWPSPVGPEIECPFCVDGTPPWDGDWEMQRHDSLHDR